MTDLVKVTVRLPREVHAEVRARAFREGVTLDGLGRRWFGEYAGLGEREVGGGDARENRAGGMASRGGATESATLKQEPVASRSPSPSFRPDPKRK